MDSLIETDLFQAVSFYSSIDHSTLIPLAISGIKSSPESGVQTMAILFLNLSWKESDPT